jgi:hypothetical protein
MIMKTENNYIQHGQLYIPFYTDVIINHASCAASQAALETGLNLNNSHDLHKVFRNPYPLYSYQTYFSTPIAMAGRSGAWNTTNTPRAVSHLRHVVCSQAINPLVYTTLLRLWPISLFRKSRVQMDLLSSYEL